MADNYLENKFEEYAARKAGRLPRRAAVQSHRSGYAEFRFTRRRVLVLNGLSAAGRAIVSRFRSVDCRVAFCDADAVEGQRFAETVGARFHQAGVGVTEDVTEAMCALFHDWGDIDILVSLADDDITAAAVACLADLRRNGPVPNDYCRIFAFAEEPERLPLAGLPTKCFAPTAAADERIPSLLVMLSTDEAALLL